MTVTSIFTDIASGLGAFAPALGKSVLDMFVNLFLTSSGTETITYALNPLGTFALVALVIAICYKVLPMAFNFIVKKSRTRKSRKARA